MTTKYMTKCGRIEKKEITRETVNSVFFFPAFSKEERCERKMTDYQCYFDTFRDAKNYLLAVARSRVEQEESRLLYYKNELAKVELIKEEDVK